MDSFNPILLFILRELIKIAWILAILCIFVFIYLIILYVNKSRNYKRMTEELGFPMPDIANTLMGHIREHTSVQKQAEWHKRLGKIYGFYNCDAPHLRVSNLDMINEVFLKQNKIFSARTFNEYRLIPFNDGILFSSGAPWRRARRLIYPIMSSFRMRSDESSASGGGTMNEELSRGISLLVGHFRQLAAPNNDQHQQQQHSPQVQSKAQQNDDGQEQDEGQDGKARNCCDPKRYCEINQRGYTLVADSRSPTGHSIDIKVHGVMEALTLDIIMRIGLDIEEVDVRKGTSDPLVKFVDSWLSDFDDPVAKIAQAIPLLRLLVPFILAFNKSFRRYFNFMINIYERRKKLLLLELDTSGSRAVATVANGKQHDGSRRGLQAGDEAAKSAGTGPVDDGDRGRKSVLRALIEEYLAGRMRKREVIANASATIVAGFETTATTSSYIIWCIARHPELKAKLLADILANGMHSRYLDMFIKETMRMYPALANFVIRSPIEDTVVAGRHIGRGMSVYLDMIAVHYDESIYPDPYKFDPERFAEGRTYPPGAYVPFGLGHRMCAGTHLALREMKIIVTELLKNFDIELISPQLQLELESLTIFLTRSKHEIRVRLIPRDGQGTETEANGAYKTRKD